MNIQEFLKFKDFHTYTNKKLNKLVDEAEKLEQIKPVQLKLKELQLFQKYNGIGDFYPTPSNVGEYILNSVKIYDNFKILEPSAGTGILADKLKELSNARNNAKLDCVEKNQELAEFLREKGHKTYCIDFMDFEPGKKYDLIVMNPPFENILEHINKAYSMLSSNGVLHCIVPENFEQKYRKFVDDTGAVFWNFYGDMQKNLHIRSKWLEINKEEITNFQKSLLEFFTTTNGNNLLEMKFYFYLNGDYKPKYREEAQKHLNPSDDLLFKWFKSALCCDFGYSIAYISKAVDYYKNYPRPLIDIFFDVFPIEERA